jgi:hypothetical protein
MILEPCLKCNGNGHKTITFEYNDKKYKVYEQCGICGGKGKTDWIKNITKEVTFTFLEIGRINYRCLPYKIYDGKYYIPLSSKRGQAINAVFVEKR